MTKSRKATTPMQSSKRAELRGATFQKTSLCDVKRVGKNVIRCNGKITYIVPAGCGNPSVGRIPFYFSLRRQEKQFSHVCKVREGSFGSVFSRERNQRARSLSLNSKSGPPSSLPTNFSKQSTRRVVRHRRQV